MGNWREAPTGRFRKLCFNTNIAPADPPSGTAPCVPRLGEKWTVTEIEVRALASLEGQPDALNALSPISFGVSMDLMLKMQLPYDIAKTRKLAKRIKVQRFKKAA